MLRKLYIEPTTKCNLNCKMCFRHTWFDEPICDLTLEDYRQVLATMPKSVETIFFGGMGEPLFHKDILEMIRLASDTGAEVDADRHWWVQAESVVGYFNFWEHFGQPDGLENAIMCWEFIKDNIIDKDGGEWFWSLRADGSVNREDDKAGFWKCPYHNGRMCMEVMEHSTLIY